MAEQWPCQQDLPEYSISNGVQKADICSFDPEYLTTCVRFAQRHGIFPTSPRSQPDTNLPFNQSQSTIFGHQRLDPCRSYGNYPNPYTSNTFAGPNYFQHNHGNHPDPFSASWDNDAVFEENQIHVSSPSASSANPEPQGTISLSGPPIGRQDPASPMSSKNDIGKHGLAVLHNYDPLWVQKTGLDPRSVFEPRSKMKFESLFIEGVIQQGSRLVIAVACNIDGVVRQDVATLTHVGFSKAVLASGNKKKYPDLVLTLCEDPDYRQTILACKGTNAIVEKFHELHIDGSHVNNTEIAAHLNVWRGDQDLGTLEYVKQAYHSWRNDMDASHARTGTTWRRRRGDSSKTVAMADRKPGREKGLKKFMMGAPGAEE